MAGSGRDGFESRVQRRCEAMRAAGKSFSEDVIRREHAAAETRVDHKMAEARQRQRFTHSKPESRPRGTVTTIIHADGSVDHVDRDISAKEAFGETGISNISRKKDKAGAGA